MLVMGRRQQEKGEVGVCPEVLDADVTLSLSKLMQNI